MAIHAVTTYCSSSNRIHPDFHEAAAWVGRALALHDLHLVYGGGAVGLMGTLARAVHEQHGHVVGVIPHALKDKEGIAYELADELILTNTMRERKRIMYERGDAYLVLPGGYGTLEEFMEVLTLRQLGYHNRPIVLLNLNGFWDSLMGVFAEMNEQGFIRTSDEPLFRIISDPGDVIDALTDFPLSP